MRPRLLCLGLALCLSQLPAAEVDASVVYGIQASTGRILTIDPTTGAVITSFVTPAAISASQTGAGLTYAAPLNQLLYFNQSASSTLYRLDPTTGAVISTATGDTFTNAGLSYERVNGQDYLYYNHLNDDIHRQTGFGGPTSFFFTPGTSTTGVGGDGYGREFAAYSDGTIKEFDLLSGAILRSFSAPVGVLGLAFDGTSLYASTNQGQLLTLNANTGAVLRTVTVAGGNLIELGANAASTGTVPEPASLAMLGVALAGAAAAPRLRGRSARG